MTTILPAGVTCEPTDFGGNGVMEPSYHVASTILPGCAHYVDLVESTWRIWPVPTDPAGSAYLTVDEAREYVREIRKAIDVAARLNAKPKVVTPFQAAVTAEIEALIGDRGWTPKEAAAEFGIKPTTFVHRLNGHSNWTLGDLCDIAAGLAEDDDDLTELMIRIFQVGSDATRKAEQTRRTGHSSAVDDRHRALDD